MCLSLGSYVAYSWLVGDISRRRQGGLSDVLLIPSVDDFFFNRKDLKVLWRDCLLVSFGDYTELKFVYLLKLSVMSRVMVFQNSLNLDS